MTYRVAFNDNDFNTGVINANQITGTAATISNGGGNTFTNSQTINAPFINNGYLNLPYKVVTASSGTTYNVVASTDCILVVGGFSGVETIQLPYASAAVNQIFIVKNIGSKSVTIAKQSGDTMNGSLVDNASAFSLQSYPMSQTCTTVQSIDATGWVVI